MSQQNLEIVRGFVDCWTRLDWDGLAAFVDPDVERLATVGGIDPGPAVRGVDQIRRDYEQSEEAWEAHWLELDELIDCGGDRVVIFHREHQRGKGSGVELQIDAAVIVDLRDGRIVRIQGYLDRAAALEAAGCA